MRVALLLLASCGGSDGVGTVVYTDPMGAISKVDVATGEVTLLDPGVFGGLAIAPDGQHVAYVGNDGVPKVNDLAGNVTMLPGSATGMQLQWWGDALAYQVIDSNTQVASVELVARPGAAPRRLTAQQVQIADDQIALFDPSTGQGLLALEDLDGNHHVPLASNTGGQFSFSSDGGTFVFTDADGTNLVIARYDLASGTRTRLRPGNTLRPVPGTSIVSPDGSEVLGDDGTNTLVGLAADGSEHIYVHGRGPSGFVELAGYLDNGLVVADLGSRVLITDGVTPRTLGSSDGSQCFASEVSRPLGQILMECSSAAIVDFTGELVSSRNALTAVGMSSDGAGVISLDNNGVLEITTARGTRTLAQAMPPASGFVSAPLAVYAGP